MLKLTNPDKILVFSVEFCAGAGGKPKSAGNFCKVTVLRCRISAERIRLQGSAFCSAEGIIRSFVAQKWPSQIGNAQAS